MNHLLRQKGYFKHFFNNINTFTPVVVFLDMMQVMKRLAAYPIQLYEPLGFLLQSYCVSLLMFA